MRNKSNKFKVGICFIFPEFMSPPGNSNTLSLGNYASST